MKNATYNTAKKTVAYAIAAFSFFALCACSADSSIAAARRIDTIFLFIHSYSFFLIFLS